MNPFLKFLNKKKNYEKKRRPSYPVEPTMLQSLEEGILKKKN